MIAFHWNSTSPSKTIIHQLAAALCHEDDLETAAKIFLNELANRGLFDFVSCGASCGCDPPSLIFLFRRPLRAQIFGTCAWRKYLWLSDSGLFAIPAPANAQLWWILLADCWMRCARTIRVCAQRERQQPSGSNVATFCLPNAAMMDMSHAAAGFAFSKLGWKVAETTVDSRGVCQACKHQLPPAKITGMVCET